MLAARVSEAIEARRGSAKVDDDEEERRQRVYAKVRADPGQAEWQNKRLALRPSEELNEGANQHRRRDR
jgi:hypothetical protein